MRILCAGDLHLGRRSSKVPTAAEGAASCRGAWLRLVDCAIRERVHVVALSGDLVDHDNRWFEALGPLEQGLRRLAETGIRTYAVAGNHDYDTLPLLARTIDVEGFRLLGESGTWERATVVRDGRPLLHVDGWSFPAAQVPTSPLLHYPRRAGDGVPVLGLLHADLDQPGSRYGPVALADLRQTPVDLWLLGHIHQPALFPHDGGPAVLYPGSVQAMDPGEPGPHGACLVELVPGAPPVVRPIPLSSVRYDTIAVDLTDAEDEAEVRARVVEAVRAALRAAAGDAGPLEHLCCRVRLTGRTRLHRALETAARGFEDDFELPDDTGRIVATIERVIIDTRPAVDLVALAGAPDPTGEIARLLLALDREGEPPAEYRPLLERTVAALRHVHSHKGYQAVASDAVPDTALARAHLVREGWRLLDTLLHQREGTA
ncbi:MAG: DNA repair exonuclease [Sphaerobacter sp.]|nr:DNA repair exonuclease [Sphaerobacter sp.]